MQLINQFTILIFFLKLINSIDIYIKESNLTTSVD